MNLLFSLPDWAQYFFVCMPIGTLIFAFIWITNYAIEKSKERRVYPLEPIDCYVDSDGLIKMPQPVNPVSEFIKGPSAANIYLANLVSPSNPRNVHNQFLQVGLYFRVDFVNCEVPWEFYICDSLLEVGEVLQIAEIDFNDNSKTAGALVSSIRLTVLQYEQWKSDFLNDQE